jgi:hypothetical protein
MLTKPIFKAIIILGDKIYEYISKTPAQGWWNIFKYFL